MKPQETDKHEKICGVRFHCLQTVETRIYRYFFHKCPLLIANSENAHITDYFSKMSTTDELRHGLWLLLLDADSCICGNREFI
jgi:hypothetical protein